MERNSPDTLHTMVEAKKIVWADRAKYYADPAFAKIPLTKLLSKEYATERRKLIDSNRANKHVDAGNVTQASSLLRNRQDAYVTARANVLDNGDTIYMCTADDE